MCGFVNLCSFLSNHLKPCRVNKVRGHRLLQRKNKGPCEAELSRAESELGSGKACSQEGLLLSVVINNTLRFLFIIFFPMIPGVRFHIGARSLNFSGHKFNDLVFEKYRQEFNFQKISKSLYLSFNYATPPPQTKQKIRRWNCSLSYIYIYIY